MGRTELSPNQARDAAALAGATARPRRPAMSASAHLGFAMLAPSFIIVALLFLAPVVLTGVYSFTTMTTGTGISGGAYQIDEATIAALREQGFPADVLDRLGTESFTVDASILSAFSRRSRPAPPPPATSRRRARRFVDRS